MHDKLKSRSRRDIPSVSKVLDSLPQDAGEPWTELPRLLVVDFVRRELSAIRAGRRIPEFRAIVDRIRESLEKFHARKLVPVINGTGVIVHTNFGRVPLALAARNAIQEIAASYSNLEYDLLSGERGHRGEYLEEAVAQLCGAEAATVVNNCAAALVLITRHFVSSKLDRLKRSSSALAKPEVIVSRGELVQIGGGFRIGEILEASGANIREIGATNKTNLSDYARAIGKQTALILKVHRSNFFMEGFVDSPETAEIAAVARKKRVPIVEDLGSGAVFATDDIGLHEHEPTPNEAIKSGADLVCFSGDKLFGGPQAGIIVGRKRFIAALKREPIFRALRCDKLTFAALQATLDLHLKGLSAQIPVVALLQTPKDELRARAAAIIERLRGLPLQLTIGRGVSKIGGGALPRSIIPSVAIDIVPQGCSVPELAEFLRRSSPPLVGYISNDRWKLDLRTIFPDQDDIVIDLLRQACTKCSAGLES
jgi:L-seryl-tRNA(Ser) seleniumtransferase